MKTPIISLIASVDEENGIGFGGKIPWYIPEDFKWFRKNTLEHVVLMGRKTYESILKRLGKPLPGRINIVVSREKDLGYRLDEALKLAKKKEKRGEIFIIGGGQIYNQTIGIAERLYLTKVRGKYKADIFFPDYSDFKKEVLSRKGSSNGFDFIFKILERK